MKFIKTFLSSLGITLVIIILLYGAHFASGHFGQEYLAELLQERLTAFINSKLIKNYPRAVFVFMFFGASLELCLSFKTNSNWPAIAKDKSQKNLVKIGGAILGVISALVLIAVFEKDYDEAIFGWKFLLFAALNIASPFFLVGVLYMLREPHSNPRDEFIAKVLARFLYCAFILGSIYGFFYLSSVKN